MQEVAMRLKMELADEEFETFMTEFGENRVIDFEAFRNVIQDGLDLK